MYILKILIFLQLLFLITSNQNINPSPRTGPQDLLVTHYDCEENEQKTLHKYAINQVSQCETEPQAIESTNVIATLYSKARATTVIGYKFTATFSEKKVHCSQVSNGNKNRLDHESFYQINIERNKDMLYRLTTPLTPRQFTYIGYKKSLKTHTAPRANEYTLEYYDHNIIRANQDQFLDDDRFANPQITEKFFIKTPYVFTLNIFDRKFDHIISEALTDTQAYESFKERFQIFSLTFHFLAPHERDLHCSHDIMLRTKQTHTYTYYRFIQNHFDLHTPSRQPHHRFQFINSKYTSPFFLNFTYCIKDTNLHGILRNYDPITQMYIFCPITKTLNAEGSRPFLIPHEFVQPIEIPILEFIHNTKFNHKLYNLIQNTPYEFAVGTEELTTIKALQLLWPLLQTKNIIRILAKLLTTSDLIQDIFPHGFFPDD